MLWEGLRNVAWSGFRGDTWMEQTTWHEYADQICNEAVFDLWSGLAILPLLALILAG
jgi:hypothetical protein